MKLDRIKLNTAGLRQLLNSAGVSKELDRKAGRVAAAAGEGYAVDSETGGSRARSTVYPDTSAAAAAERTEMVLTKAIGAAHG